MQRCFIWTVNLLNEWLSWNIFQSLFSRVWGQYAFIISLCRQRGEASGWLNGNQWNQMSLNSFTAALRKFSLILLPRRENVKWLDVCEWLLWWKCGEEEIQGQGQTCLAAWLLFPGSMVTKNGNFNGKYGRETDLCKSEFRREFKWVTNIHLYY